VRFVALTPYLLVEICDATRLREAVYLQRSSSEAGRLYDPAHRGRLIAEVAKELDDCETRLQELRKTKSDLLKQMRAAARDEGTLPLFDDLTHTLSVTPAGHEASI
jgi:hypothetical protein